MKKTIFILATILAMLFQTRAAAQNDTTIHFNQKRIHLEDSIGQMKVNIYDENGNQYNKVYEGIFSDGKSYEKWTVLEVLDIDLPFLNKITRSKKKKHKMEAHWAGLGWGFANISDKNFALNNIDGVSLQSESSNEFFWNIAEKILPIYRNNLGLTTGLGLSWHNYFLDNNSHLLELNGVTNVYLAPAAVNYEFSRLRTFQINVPLMLEFQPNFGTNHKFFVTAGVVGGVTTFSSYKVKYKDANGNNIKFVESKGLNVAPVNLDFMGQIGYGNLSVYAKYSPFSIFQSQKGPDVRAVSVGGLLHF